MVSSVEGEEDKALESARSTLQLDTDFEEELEAMPNFLEMTKEEILNWIYI